MRALISFVFLFFIQLNQMAFAVTAVKDKAIPSLTNEPVGAGSYLQMFLGLTLVVGLIFGMAWLMRRVSGVNGMSTGNLKVLGGVSVGQREKIVLVQAGDVQLLVGVAPGEIRTLHVMEEPIVTTESTSKISSGFAEKLHTAIKNRNNA